MGALFILINDKMVTASDLKLSSTNLVIVLSNLHFPQVFQYLIFCANAYRDCFSIKKEINLAKSAYDTHTDNIYLIYVTLTLWFEIAIEHSLLQDYKKLHHNYYIHIYVYIHMYIYIYIRSKIGLGKGFEEFCRRMRLKWYFRNEPTLYFKKRQFLILRRMGNHLI